MYTVPLSALMVRVVWLWRAIGRHSRFKNFRIGPSLLSRTGIANSNLNLSSKLRRSLWYMLSRLKVESDRLFQWLWCCLFTPIIVACRPLWNEFVFAAAVVHCYCVIIWNTRRSVDSNVKVMWWCTIFDFCLTGHWFYCATFYCLFTCTVCNTSAVDARL